ncbi:MAG: type III-A CRISPR-associated RAMP protein Csm3 [Deltaproteobacteria bacterium HGW-Deltaproteobacteria-15]|jgi:CRISPR-associated protein Csm3|nr:MAG: type III-A CRISPR-associated RAMP protein Csm3 [Deltaproteobacteria bacterium HGW-Deltaproteobacteria-15]
MKLQRIRTIKGRIHLLTGLHIGASKESIEIGGLDNPVIKDPFPGSRAPYIPGSSLKGKLRSLIEIKEERLSRDPRTQGNPCDCGDKKCPVCPVFGTSANKRNDDLGPTRLVVRDAFLSPDWEKKFKEGDLPMEIKYENAINRITGEANPRPIERVPAGVEFDFNISFKVFEGDSDDYFMTVLKAMHMLEHDALGGAGSRGCGQIEFSEIRIDNEKMQPDYIKTIKVE